MKILWIESENLKTGLKINRINFNKDITLLVGVSGVGKTQILKVVEYSLKLATDKDVILYPYRVGMGILIENEEYKWFYEVKKSDEDDLLIGEESRYVFSYEKLECNGKKIFERNSETVSVVGYHKVPQPKKNESLIWQYSEDKNFEKLISGIRNLYSLEIGLDVRNGIRSESFKHLKLKVSDIIASEEKVELNAFSHLSAALKLYIVKRYYPNLYIKIFDTVKELFIELEDIDVEKDSIREMYLVSIQIYGKKLLQNDISSGMLKTIYYVVELFTMAENSLVLIDEFENGLGANCIDLLSEMMLSERNDLQFIITSHHPKIMNAIDKSKWRIINRSGSVVENSDSLEYDIGNSQHDAYFTLINKWEFEGKV